MAKAALAVLCCSGCAVFDSSEQTSLVAGGAVSAADPASAGQGASETGAAVYFGAEDAGTAAMPADVVPTAAPVRSPAPLMELPQVLAASRCAALDQCLGDAALDRLLDHEDCVQRISQELLATAFAGAVQAVEAGRLLYDPAGLEECLKAIESLACDVETQEFPSECLPVLVGNVAPGGECGGDLECGPEATCQPDEDCVARCVERAELGASCVTTRSCVEGLLCREGACVEPVAEGGSCGGEGGAVCELGLVCLASAAGASGRCTVVADAPGFGDACDPDGVSCADGLACLQTADAGFTCVEPTEEPGAACQLGLPGECAAGEYCDLSQGLLAGTCRTLPGPGEPCAGLLCSAGSVCIPSESGNLCQPVLPNGQPCLVDAMCRSNHCVDLLCEPPTVCE